MEGNTEGKRESVKISDFVGSIYRGQPRSLARCRRPPPLPPPIRPSALSSLSLSLFHLCLSPRSLALSLFYRSAPFCRRGAMLACCRHRRFPGCSRRSLGRSVVERRIAVCVCRERAERIRAAARGISETPRISAPRVCPVSLSLSWLRV